MLSFNLGNKAGKLAENSTIISKHFRILFTPYECAMNEN